MKNNIEYWCAMEEAGGYYEISSFGRVRNKVCRNFDKYEKRIKKLANDKRHKCIFFQTTRDGITYRIGVANLVYKYFGTGICKNGELYVKHKDGDYTNNHIENLYIRSYEGEKAEDWQLEIFNQCALIEIKKVVQYNYLKFLPKDFDPDELIQTALIKAWENLPKLAPNEPFYSYCMRYVKYAYWNLRHEEIEKRKVEIRR